MAANAVIQRQGAPVVLVATHGFEDVPFIQRINRKSEYDLQWRKPQPLVRRRWCIGARERLNARGEAMLPLSEDAVDEVVAAIRRIREQEPIEAIAVCLLFAYLNPTHELQLRRRLATAFPSLPVSLSHNVAPIWREYERSSTVLADAYVKPLVSYYCQSLELMLAEKGVTGHCSILKSDGGTTLLSNAARRPIDILLSGLAGGIVGGRYWARQARIADVVTLDMGGTSADVGLIIGGQQRFTTEFEIEWGLPVAVPIVEVRTLGAGGGSIAWIDKGGMLNVGPRSAGAHARAGGLRQRRRGGDRHRRQPGPRPPERRVLPRRRDEARRRPRPRRCRPGWPNGSAAPSRRRLPRSSTSPTRTWPTRSGSPPSTAASTRETSRWSPSAAPGRCTPSPIAQKLGIPRVLVPPHPGLVSALGAAISELRVEKVRTLATLSTHVTDAELTRQFAEMDQEARAELVAEGLRGEAAATWKLSMRYFQQNYEQDVEFPHGEGLGACLTRFHQLHHEFYGYSFPEQAVELVHLRLSVYELDRGAERGPQIREASPERSGGGPGRRPGWEAGGQVQFSVYRRSELVSGAVLNGPAIIEEMDSTTFVPSDSALRVDESGSLIISFVKDARS